jgi:hypothetical protein
MNSSTNKIREMLATPYFRISFTISEGIVNKVKNIVFKWQFQYI